MEHVDEIAEMMVEEGGGVDPFFAFEMNETSGLTLYDTGAVPDGRTAAIDGVLVTFADLGSGQRGIDFPTTGAGVASSPDDSAVVGAGLTRTVEAQFYVDGNAGTYPVICALQASGGLSEFYLLYSSDPNYYLTAKNAGIAGVGSRNTSLPPRDQWSHVVVSMTGDVVNHIRLNGVVETIVSAVAWTANSNVTRFGNYGSPGAVFSHKGMTNFVRVYDSQMTEAETLTLYNNRPSL